MTEFEKYIVSKFGGPLPRARKCWENSCKWDRRDPKEEENRLEEIFNRDLEERCGLKNVDGRLVKIGLNLKEAVEKMLD